MSAARVTPDHRPAIPRAPAGGDYLRTSTSVRDFPDKAPYPEVLRRADRRIAKVRAPLLCIRRPFHCLLRSASSQPEPDELPPAPTQYGGFVPGVSAENIYGKTFCDSQEVVSALPATSRQLQPTDGHSAAIRGKGGVQRWTGEATRAGEQDRAAQGGHGQAPRREPKEAARTLLPLPGGSSMACWMSALPTSWLLCSHCSASLGPTRQQAREHSATVCRAGLVGQGVDELCAGRWQAEGRVRRVCAAALRREHPRSHLCRGPYPSDPCVCVHDTW